MKLARFGRGDYSAIGVVQDEGLVALDGLGFATMRDIIDGGPAALAKIGEFVAGRKSDMQLAGVRLLAPIERPGKYLAIGMNYAKHVAEADKLGVARAAHQTWFNKQTTCISGPFDEIEPGVTEKLDYEVELGAVIGTRAKHVQIGRAHV